MENINRITTGNCSIDPIDNTEPQAYQLRVF